MLLNNPGATEPAPLYTPVAAGVSFDSVLQLTTGTPTSLHRYGPAPSQFAELWLPLGAPASETEPGALPVVAFIHGGCWLSEFGIEHSHALATALKRAGYAVWNIEYRRVGEAGGGWPGSLQDIRAAIAALNTIDARGLDLGRLVLAGHSAGGHLALLAATDQPVIGLAPIVDLAGYARGTGSCNQAALKFMAANPEEAVAAYRAATPAVRAKDRILMGDRDQIVPPRDEYLPPGYGAWSDAGHFDWLHPGTPAWDEFLIQLQDVLK
jgi:acetyl esterase/lipase